MLALGVNIVYNHADYRLMSRRAVEGLAQFKEVNLFLRGMIPLVGFKSTSVYYERHERMAGESHYPLSKMLGLALDGITSMSTRPIRLITGLGCLVALISFVGVIIFALFTAYDTQRLLEIGMSEDETVRSKGAVLGALTLYLDFINLFLMLLRFFGGRDE
jgi:hypothetical protein